MQGGLLLESEVADCAGWLEVLACLYEAGVGGEGGGGAEEVEDVGDGVAGSDVEWDCWERVMLAGFKVVVVRELWMGALLLPPEIATKIWMLSAGNDFCEVEDVAEEDRERMMVMGR